MVFGPTHPHPYPHRQVFADVELHPPTANSKNIIIESGIVLHKCWKAFFLLRSTSNLRYKCEYCDYFTRWKNVYAIHIRRHTGESYQEARLDLMWEIETERRDRASKTCLEILFWAAVNYIILLLLLINWIDLFHTLLSIVNVVGIVLNVFVLVQKI